MKIFEAKQERLCGNLHSPAAVMWTVCKPRGLTAVAF